MYTDRRASINIGVIFIVATIAVFAAAAVLPPLAGSTSSAIAPAALLYLLAAGTSVGIAVFLYPILARINPTLALAAVVFRTIEAVFYTVSVVLLLSVPPLGDTALAELVLNIRLHADQVAVVSFSVGAFLYYWVFWRSRLVPRWISGWGMLAALSILTACVIAIFSNTEITGYVPLILPIAVQEMVLAVWLLAKGFNSNALKS